MKMRSLMWNDDMNPKLAGDVLRIAAAKLYGNNPGLSYLVLDTRAVLLGLVKKSWQPIETAPKTTHHILLFGDGLAFESCAYVGSWYEGQWNLFGGGCCSPRYWMPLPQRPKEPTP